MPFVNGVWVPEDANVASRVSNIIRADSPFIQRAKTEAKQEPTDGDRADASYTQDPALNAMIKRAGFQELEARIAAIEAR